MSLAYPLTRWKTWLVMLLRRTPGCSLGRWTQPEDSVPSDADKETIKKHTVITDFMLINTSVLLVVVRIAENFKRGVWLVRECVTSGGVASTRAILGTTEASGIECFTVPRQRWRTSKHPRHYLQEQTIGISTCFSSLAICAVSLTWTEGECIGSWQKLAHTVLFSSSETSKVDQGSFMFGGCLSSGSSRDGELGAKG